MGPNISLKEALQRVIKAKKLDDIKALFRDVFGLPEAKLQGIDGIHTLPDAEAPIAIAAAAHMANPNYAKGGGFTTNCQRCAPAYELLRRGVKVCALANNSDGTGTSKRQFMNGSECFIGATVKGFGYDEILPINKKALLRALNLLPNGARAGIFWVTPDGSSGHVIMCEKVEGELNFIDPQSGRIGSHVLGEASRENGYYWYRTDNAALDPDFEWDEIVGEI